MEKNPGKKNAIFKSGSINCMVSIFVVFLLVFTSFATVIGKDNLEENTDNFNENIQDNVINSFYQSTDDDKITVNMGDENQIDSNEDSTQEYRKLNAFPFLKKPEEVDYSKYTKKTSQYNNINNNLDNNYYSSSSIGQVLSGFIQRIVERFPRLAELSIFRVFSNSVDTNNEVETSYQPSDEADDGSGYRCSVGALSNGEETEEEGDIVIIPTAGSFLFMGQGNMDLDLAMDINGTTVTIISQVYIGPNTGYVEIMWNLSQGYLEIDTDGYFEFSDFYLNVDDVIILELGGIIMDSDGYLLIDDNANTGSMSFDGIYELSGFSLEISNGMANFTLSGSLDLSQSAILDNLTISWGEDGFSANGSYFADSTLTINDFFISYNVFNVLVETITIYGPTAFIFEEIDTATILCSVSTTTLDVENLYINYKSEDSYAYFVENFVITGQTLLNLQIVNPDDYINSEEGHLSISGSMFVSIDTVLEIDGTTVEIEGDFLLGGFGNYGFGNSNSVEFWWNKSEGYFKMESRGGISKVFDLSIGIDGSWIYFGCSAISLESDTHIVIEKSGDNAVLQYQGSKTKIRGVYFHGSIQGTFITLNIGSIFSQTNGACYVNATWNNETGQPLIVEAWATKDTGIAITNIEVDHPDIANIYVGDLFLFGSWELKYCPDYIRFKLNGTAQFTGFMIARCDYIMDMQTGEVDTILDPIVDLGYVFVDGITIIEIYGSIVEITLEDVDASFGMGAGPIGEFSVRIFGGAHVIWNIAEGKVHGSFWGGGSAQLGFGSMPLFVTFQVDGSFVLENNHLMIEVSVDLDISTQMDMRIYQIFGLVFGVDISAHISGGCSVVVDIDILTGNITFDVACIMLLSAHFKITGYYDETNYFYLKEGEYLVYIDKLFIDPSVSGVAHGIIILQGNEDSLWAQLVITDASGGGSIYGYIEGFHLRSTYDNPKYDLFIGVEEIEFEGDITFEADLTYVMCLIGCGGSSVEYVNADVYLSGSLEINGVSIDFAQPVYSESSPQDDVTVTTFEGYLEGKLEIGNINLLLDDNLNDAHINYYMSRWREGSIEDGDLSGHLDTIITFEGDIGFSIMPKENEEYAISFEGKQTPAEYSSKNFKEIKISGHVGELSVDLEDFKLEIVNTKTCYWIMEDYPYGYVSDWEVTNCVSAEGNAALNIKDFYLDLKFDTKRVIVGWDELDIKFGGKIIINEEGIVEVECGVYVSLDGIELLVPSSNLEIAIDKIDVNFDGKVKYYPPDEETGEPATIEIDGLVDVVVEDDQIDASFSAGGKFTIGWKQDSNGLWMVDFTFDGEVNIDYFNLDAILTVANLEIPLNLVIENYHGEGMFDFSYNGGERSIYLNNQIEGEWGAFQITFFTSLGDVALHADINQFYGDVTISDITVYDYDNQIKYGMETYAGYTTYVGFSFSSDTGFDFNGEITGAGGNFGISVKEIHLEEGTKGDFYVAKDSFGHTYLHFEVEEGVADVSVEVQIGDKVFTIQLSLEKGDAPFDLDIDGSRDIGWDIEDKTNPIKFFTQLVAQVIQYYNENGKWPINLYKSEVDGIPLYQLLKDLGISVPDEWVEASKKSCFLEGTKIQMVEGSLKNIEEVKVGDEVVSYDVAVGEWKTGTVNKVFLHSPEEMTDYYLLINDDLRVTPNHPVFINSQQLSAKDLKLGDNFGGNIITSIKEVYEKVPTYNLEVLPYHTFNVVWGENAKSLVHNEDTNPQAGSSLQQPFPQEYIVDQQLSEHFFNEVLPQFKECVEAFFDNQQRMLSGDSESYGGGSVGGSDEPEEEDSEDEGWWDRGDPYDPYDDVYHDSDGNIVAPSIAPGIAWGDDYTKANALVNALSTAASYDLSSNVANAGMPLNIDNPENNANYQMSPKNPRYDGLSASANTNGLYDLAINGQTVASDLTSQELTSYVASIDSSSNANDESSGGDGNSDDSSSEPESCPTNYCYFSSFGSFSPIFDSFPLDIPIGFDGSGSVDVSRYGMSADTRIFVLEKYDWDVPLAIEKAIPREIPPIPPIAPGEETVPLDEDIKNPVEAFSNRLFNKFMFSSFSIPTPDVPLRNPDDVNEENSSTLTEDPLNSDQPVQDSTLPIFPQDNESQNATNPILNNTEPLSVSDYTNHPLSSFYEEDDMKKYNSYWPVADLVKYDKIQVYNPQTGEMDISVVSSIEKHVVENKYIDIIFNWEEREENIQKYESNYATFDSILYNTPLSGVSDGFEVSIGKYSHYADMSYPEVLGKSVLSVGPDQLVYIDGGFKKASSIEIGDNILTEDGYKTVEFVETNYKVITTYTIFDDENILPEDELEDNVEGPDIDIPGLDVQQGDSNSNSLNSLYADSLYFADGVLVAGQAVDEGLSVNENNFAEQKETASGFTSGTMIKMADGTSKDISLLNIKDQIKAFGPSSKVLTNTFVSSIKFYERHTGYMLQVSLVSSNTDTTAENIDKDSSQDSMVNDNIDENKLILTIDQPVYILQDPELGLQETNLVIISAEELKPGHALITEERNIVYVAGTKMIKDITPVYELEVEPYHNYYANNVLVSDGAGSDSDDFDDDTDPNTQKDGITLSSYESINFGYYNSLEYSLFNREKSKLETQNIQKITSNKLTNIILLLAEKFPVLMKIRFIREIVEESQEHNENTDEGEDSEDDDSSIDPAPSNEDPFIDDLPLDPDPYNENVADDSVNNQDEKTSHPLYGVYQNIKQNPGQIHYIWYFGDGTYGYGLNPTHNYHIEPDDSYINELNSGGSTTLSIYSSESVTYEQTYNIKLCILASDLSVIDIDFTTITMKLPFKPADSSAVAVNNDEKNLDISYKDIQDLTTDDKVVSFNKLSSLSINLETSDVSNIVEKESTEEVEYIVIDYGLSNAEFEGKQIILLPLQPVFVEGVYVPANEIQTGDILYTINMNKVIVKSVTTNRGYIKAYEISLEDYHNFYLNDILLGDSSKLDIDTSLDVGYLMDRVGILSDQKIAVENLQNNCNGLQMCF